MMPAPGSPTPSLYEPGGDPLGYPGPIATSSLLVRSGRVEPIVPDPTYRTFRTTDGGDVDDLLGSIGAPSIGERVAQLAFGANRSIGNLLWKLGRHDPRRDALRQTLVTVPAVVVDADVVACNIGYWGYVYGGLLKRGSAGPDPYHLRGRRCPARVLLLDELQMRSIHTSEGVLAAGDAPAGVSCRIGEIDVHLSDRVVCTTQMYSPAVPFLSFDRHQPVALAAVATIGRRGGPVMSQAELCVRLAAHLGLDLGRSRVPIADELRSAVAELQLAGDDVARTMTDHPRYRSVRRTIAERLTLIDADGSVRQGLDGVLPLRPANEAFSPRPQYRPRPVT